MSYAILQERKAYLSGSGSQEREEKRRAFAELRFHPHRAAGLLDDPAADGQPDPGAGIFVARVEALEDGEDAMEILRLDADAVVANGKDPDISFAAAETPMRGVAALRYLRALLMRFCSNCTS